ncbi:MAG: hypothetical protein EOP81_02250 [Variovorax sp.]|nr:MAG: hypothetical protein EOP81_02250 [Variovorax sp.]
MSTGMPDGWMAVDKYDTVEITSKVCRRCHCEMELMHFSPHATGRGGVKSTCKACCAEAAADYASTPRGRAARARANAKFVAAQKAQEAADAAYKQKIEQIKQTPAGRAMLARYGVLEASPSC